MQDSFIIMRGPSAGRPTASALRLQLPPNRRNEPAPRCARFSPAKLATPPAMSSPDKKFYVTTPIYYVNARPHIGHAYTTVVADVVARRHRLLGDTTWFLTGTDEHGQKIERSASAAGIPPQQFADGVSQSFQDLWARMGITNDDFIRTTEPRHKQGAQKLFAELYARGEIYLSSYTGQYCVSEEMFVEGPPGTIGPDGRPTETVTEENFFFRLSNYQLPLLNLIESGQLTITPEARRNEVLSFLRGNIAEATKPGAPGLASETWVEAPPIMSSPSTTDAQGAPSMAQSYRDMGGNVNIPSATPEPATEPAAPGLASETWVEAPSPSAEGTTSGAPPIAPFAKGGVPSEARPSSSPGIAHTATGTPYLPGALKDLSVSRSSFTWGIPVPEPAASAAKDPHVIYVWLDALANYMTALGYGSNDPTDQARFHEFWPADLHLVGKEIIRFHCVYWPAFLLATGLPLPKSVVAHGWLLFEESKMSKSRGNIVRTETILDAFGDHYRRELVRLTSPSSGKPINGGAASSASVPSPLLSSRSAAEGSASPLPLEPTKAEADLFASDVLRYFLLREIPFGQDGSFSFDAMITRYNADLANGYGNLVSRVLNMIIQNRAGVVPEKRDWRNLISGLSEPKHIDSDNPRKRFSPGTDEVKQSSTLLASQFTQVVSTSDFLSSLNPIAAVTQQIDEYLSFSKPWELAKRTDSQNGQALDEVLYTAAESIRILTALLYPILPYSTAKVWAQLGLGSIEDAAARGDLKNLQWGGLKPGTKLGPLAPIFPRAPKELAQIMSDMESKPSLTEVTADNDAATSEHTEFPEAPLSDVASPNPNTPGAPSMAQSDRDMGGNVDTPSATLPSSTGPAAPPRTSTLPHHNPGSQVGASSAPAAVLPPTPSHVDAEPSGVFASATAATPITATPATATPQTITQITIDDFAKVELRVAEILVAERIPKADKLLRLEVDLGPELGQRQILSGIAEWYTPESLIGRKIVVITNLAPRKMRGLESHGMLLAASHGENGKPVLATFGEEIEAGARLK